jgi:phage terminase small subunit
VIELTIKEQKFADFYVETGNAAEAARRAGYSIKNAKHIGNRLLKDSEISIYVSGRLEQMEAARLASMQEVLEFYSAVMRGEIKDQFGLEATIADRLKAADSLMKRFAITNERDSSTLAKLDNLLQQFHDAITDEDA